MNKYEIVFVLQFIINSCISFYRTASFCSFVRKLWQFVGMLLLASTKTIALLLFGCFSCRVLLLSSTVSLVFPRTAINYYSNFPQQAKNQIVVHLKLIELQSPLHKVRNELHRFTKCSIEELQPVLDIMAVSTTQSVHMHFKWAASSHRKVVELRWDRTSGKQEIITELGCVRAVATKIKWNSHRNSILPPNTTDFSIVIASNW